MSLTSSPSETMTYWLEAATKVASATTKTYVAGLNALVEQQKAAQQASLEWLSEVTSAQSKVNSQLVESYDSLKDEGTEVAEDAARRASRAGAEVVERSGDAVVSAASKQRKAVAQTRRPKSPRTSKSASRSTPAPGPARWTGEAYESLTAAEVNEKLPQFSQRDLRGVETYEKAHQSRQTVLDKISSLHGQQPVPGYDELNVQEIQKLIAEGDDKVSTRVRDYERPRKSRDGVLQAAEAKLSKS